MGFINTSVLAGGGVLVGQAVFMEEAQPVDLTVYGKRYLRSGSIENNSGLFDVSIFTAKSIFNSTSITSSFESSAINGVTSSDSVFVAAGASGKLATSPDGINWTQRTSSFGTSIIYAVTFGNGLFVAAGDGGKLATSPDGINWTQRTSSFGTSIIYGSCYSDYLSLYIICGASGKLATSPNGITWTSRTSSTGLALRACKSSNSAMVSAGDNGVMVLSIDAVSWSTVTSSFGISQISSIESSGDAFLAAGAVGKIATSQDGMNWTQRTSGHINNISCLKNNNGVLISGSSSGGEMYKHDFIQFAGSTVEHQENGEYQYIRIS